MAKESQGIIAYWSTVTLASGSVVSSVANAIGEVVGWAGPSMSAAVIDVTDLQSTAKEKLVGVYDGGQVTFNVNMLVTDTGQTKLRESFASGVRGSCLIQLSTVTTGQGIHMKGYVTGLNITGSVDNKLAGDFTLAIHGGASFSTGA